MYVKKLIMIMVILMVLAIFQYLCLDKDFKVYVKINLYIFVMQMVLPVIVCSHFEKNGYKDLYMLKGGYKNGLVKLKLKIIIRNKTLKKFLESFIISDN